MNIFFRHLKKYRAASILAPAFKLIEALFELFVPIFVADMVDMGVGNGDTSVIIRDNNNSVRTFRTDIFDYRSILFGESRYGAQPRRKGKNV